MTPSWSWVAVLLSVAGAIATVPDNSHQWSGKHRPRHGRGEPSTYLRSHRSLEVATEVTAAVGEDVTLDCGDSGAPAAPWYHDGQRTPPSERLQARPFGQLSIRRLRVSDSGLWHCLEPASTPRPRTHAAAVMLKVFAAPEEPYILFGADPIPVTTSAPIDVRENVPMTLTCVSERSLPPAAVTWLLGDAHELNVTSQSRTVTQISDVTGLFSSRSQLTLNVTRDMMGERITCVTSHRELHVRQRTAVTLNVQYGPRFTVVRTPAFGNPILRGMRVNLTCLAEANPTVEPRWEKDDLLPRVPSRNGTILFNPIGLEDSGWYRCVATHLGNKDSSYSFYLSVRDDTSTSATTGAGGVAAAAGDSSAFRTVQTTVGAPVSLKCTDDAERDRSQGSPCWVKENPAGGQAAVTSRGYRMHLDGALYEDTGVYTCQMPPISQVETNQRTKARRFFVKVTGKPMVSNISHSSSLVLGQQASLHVMFCADPPATHVLWVMGNFAARPGHRSKLATASAVTDAEFNSCFTASLHLAALMPDMVGDVTVVVTNQLGTDQLTRQMDVTRPSHVTFNAGARSGVRHYSGRTMLVVLVCAFVTTLIVDR